MYVPLPRFLLRAPLLPVSALSRGSRALLRHRLGRTAVELASPSLAAAASGPRRDRALDRYARRAAFRATPHGLFAGVCMGTLAARTAVATGTPAAWLSPGWARVARLARLLLDDPELRVRTRLRLAASALRGASVIRWIGPGDPFDELHEAELDDRLAAISAAAERWTPWAEVRAAAAPATGDADDAASADELLLTLLDDGLLESDLAPPIIGPAPAAHLGAHLAALGETDAAHALDEASAALARGDVKRGRARLAALPGGGDDHDLHAVLVHRPAAPPTLERAAVERAARLAPLLVRLQEALAPPAAERFAQPALADALDAATELYGAGAFDVAALATGDYGVDIDDGDQGDSDHHNDGQLPPRPPHTAALTLILDAITAAGRRGAGEATVDADALTAAVADITQPRLPCSAELFLAPVPRRRGTAPGTGWLLGLHAPAGASFGRFAHPLGGEATAAIAELEAAERHARPGELSVDVAFAPSPELADLATRPATTRRRLALTRWGQAGREAGQEHDELSPSSVELVADPSDPAALALRMRDGGTPIVPASFARLRSTTAPAGIPRLLVGWSLWRQHAPWALPLGPLAELAFIPRLCLEGFVIAPASWRLPTGAHTPGTIRRWRRAAGVPRYVQVGHGDELLPVDLAASGAAADLANHERVFEIWPPLDALCDRDGRRLEAVVMLIEQPDADDTAAHLRWSAAVRAAGAVPPPHRAPPMTAWTTYKLYGSAGRQDDLLTLLMPVVRAGQHAGEIDRWFFQRYVDGPGRRHHLRLRVRALADAGGFERRLRGRLQDARAAALLTGMSVDEYHPERGRFHAGELDSVLTLFESDSELAAALSGAHALDPVVVFVRACDALASGLGLDLDARHALARERRRAAEASAQLADEDRDRADAAFRSAGRTLRAALLADAGGDQASSTDPHAPALAAHRARAAHAARDLAWDARARLLPTLLHLSAVRCLGPHPDRERLAYTFWERTLAGLRRPAGGGRRS